MSTHAGVVQTGSPLGNEQCPCDVDQAASSESSIVRVLPPYSPDFVGKLQSLLKSVQTATAKESLLNSLRWASSSITHFASNR